MGATRKCNISLCNGFIISQTLFQTSPSTSQALVSGAEQVTKLLSKTLTSEKTEAIKTQPNIGENIRLYVVVLSPYMFVVLKAERVSNETVDNGYVFPDEDDNLTAYTGGSAQLTVPGGLLQNIGRKNVLCMCTCMHIIMHLFLCGSRL